MGFNPVDLALGNMDALRVSNERLKKENAKLRELVRKVDHYERLGCYDCPHCDSCYVGTLYDDGCAMSREIEREMRELGIEVDA